MMKIFLPLLLLLTIIGSGCATLFTGTKQKVYIESQPAGALIQIDGIDYGRTPATVIVNRSVNDKLVVLKLDGYETRVFSLQKDFNIVSVLNLFSVLGWGIDIVSGAVVRYSPQHYDLELESLPGPVDGEKR